MTVEKLRPASADDALEMARATKARLRQRAREIDSEIQDIQNATWLATTGREELDTAALAMIEGRDVSAPADADGRIVELRREREVLQRALRIAQERLDEQKRIHRSATIKKLRPQHQAACRRIAAALAELSEANELEEGIRRQIPGGGGLPRAAFPGIGSRSFHDSPIRFWFRYARTHGLLDDEPLAPAAAAE